MLSQDHELQAVTIFYEELPSELTVSDLKGFGSYNFPDRERIMRPKLPETLYVQGQKFHPTYEDGSKGDIEVGQEGSFSCPIVFLENQPGIYTVVVWLKPKNIQSPAITATNICIWAAHPNCFASNFYGIAGAVGSEGDPPDALLVSFCNQAVGSASLFMAVRYLGLFFLAVWFTPPAYAQLIRNLEFLQRLPFGQAEQSLFFNQNHLVVYGGYVDFFDISGPEARRVSRLFRDGYITGAEVNLPYLFLNVEGPGEDRQEIWDLSNLGEPQLVAQFQILSASSRELRQSALGLSRRKIQWIGKHALALDAPHRLTMYETSDAARWLEIDRIETSRNISDFEVRSNRLYVATAGAVPATDFKPGSFSVYGVESSGKLSKLSSFEDPSALTFTFHLVQDFIYLFISRLGVSANFVLLDRDGKTITSAFNLPPELTGGIDAQVYDQYLYLNKARDFVFVFDVSDPLQPKFVSRISEQPNRRSLGLSIQPPFLYRIFPDLIERFSLSAPASPKQAGTVPAPARAMLMRPSGDLLWTDQAVFRWRAALLEKLADLPRRYTEGEAARDLFLGLQAQSLELWRAAESRVDLIQSLDISEINKGPEHAKPALTIVGDFAYVVGLDGFSSTASPFGGVFFDFSYTLITVDLKSLQKTHQLAFGTGRASAFSVPNLTPSIRALGLDLFVGSHAGNKILDLSDPARPRVKRDAKAFEVDAIRTGDLYFSGQGGTLQIFRVKDDQEVLLQEHRPPAKTGAGRIVAVEDGLVFFFTPDRATVLDVANPLAPREIAEFALLGRAFGVSGVAHSAGYLYVNSSFDGIAVFKLRQESLVRQILPHFAVGQLANTRYVSRLLLFNNAAEPKTGTTILRDSSGQPLSVAVAGQEVSSFSWELQPGEARAFALESSSVKSGWIEVLQSGRGFIGVSLIFQILVDDMVVSESAVLASREVNEASLFQDSTDDFTTGLALVNATSDPQKIELRLRRLDGQSIQRTSVELPPASHLARFTEELFPATDLNALFGRLEVIAPKGVALLSLKTRGHFWGTLSTDALDGLTSTYFVPQLVVGQEAGVTYETIVYISNEMGREGRLEVEIFDSSGKAMEVSVWGNRWSRFDTVLTASQTAVYRFSADDRKPTAGWLRIRGPEGLRISMVFSFRKDGRPIAGAGLTPGVADESWLSFVERDSRTDTGVAILNSRSSSNRIRWVLLDGSGVPLAEASEELLPGEQKARFVTELFPGFFADKATFRGTLRTEGDLPFSTISLRLSNTHLTAVALIKPYP